MLYDGWLGRIAKKFQQEFDNIEATYNFDLGPEFEIALVMVLRGLLPQRYGVCRGFVVGQDGERAGDDIIVYDADRFPVIRSLHAHDIARKEGVPADAVLAYIEAKHTLHLEGESDKGTSLAKALQQVARVKSINRTPRPLTHSVDGWDLTGIDLNTPGYPPICNPYYVAIWARQVRCSAADPADALTAALSAGSSDMALLPDAIFAASTIAVPAKMTEGGTAQIMPFLCEGNRRVTVTSVDDSWGTAMVHLLWAIEWIRLTDLPWSRMLSEGLRGKSGRSV